MRKVIQVLLAAMIAALVAGIEAKSQAGYKEKLRESQRMMDLVTPGKAHEFLLRFVGTWRQLCEIPQTEGPANYGKGELNVEQILGGRYVRFNSEIDFTAFGITSFITIGFDKYKEEFTFHMIDNLSTYPSIAAGNYNKPKDKFTFAGITVAPVEQKEVPFKIVIDFESNNKFTYEVYVGEGDEEQLRQKIVNIRKEPAEKSE